MQQNLKDFLKKAKDSLVIWLSRIFLIIVGLYASLQIIHADFVPSNLPLTYCSLLILPILTAFILYRLYESELSKRRTVEQAELESLYAEAKRCRDKSLAASIDVAEKEIGRLKAMMEERKPIYELDVLPLRVALVDLYQEGELVSKAEYELELLEEYTAEEDEDTYEKWEKRIEEAKKACEKEGYEKLRATLRVLREKVAWYDKTWAEGEVIIKSVSYWATVSMISIMLTGLLLIIHLDGGKILTILHWGSLGWSGALLSVLLTIRKKDVTEIGEQEGKQVLLQMVVSTSIGVMAAVLLYAALSGEIITGKIFPVVPIEGEISTLWRNTGLSIFWGIFSGFSLGILSSLVRLAESAFGKE